MSAEKPKFPRAVADAVFTDLRWALDPSPALGRPDALCDLVCAVGGYRRRRTAMKDIELLYIPRFAQREDTSELFSVMRDVDVTEQLWNRLLAAGVLSQRRKVDGSLSAWGPHNKHAVHCATGLAVDLFATIPEHWPNRLVVTTGPMESNIRIASAARARGWEWEMANGGFVPIGGTWDTCPKTRRTMRTEREVFEFVGLPFRMPEDRV